MDKRMKTYRINGEKYTITDLYIKYTIKHGYEYGRENIRRMIRSRLATDARNHRRHDMARLLAK